LKFVNNPFPLIAFKVSAILIIKLASAILTLLENEQTFVAPDAVANQAKKAIEYKDKYKDEVKGGTQVGWTRASQLANKEKISYDTIKRMYSFFKRHDGNQNVKPENKATPWKDNGHVAWLIWGGDAGYNWVKSIIKD
jgi:hypothetical protein